MWCKAICDQAQKFIHMSGTDFYYEPQVRLAEELAGIVPIEGDVRTFFGNSGTEATEAAIKLARYHTKRQGIIAFYGAFHGRSMGSLSLTASKAIQRRGFMPFMPGVYHAPYPDTYRFNGSADACAEASLSFIRDQLFVHLISPDEVGAIVVEPIQGEGGYIVPPKAFLQGLRELTAQHGIVLGLRRSAVRDGAHGKDVRPRALRLARRRRQHCQGDRVGLAARRDLRAGRDDGVAAWRARQHVRRQPGLVRGRQCHDQALKEQLVANAATVGAHLMDGLRELQQKHQIIGDIRGLGLMIGVELVKDRQTKERAVDARNAARAGHVPPRRADPGRRQERHPLRAAAGAVEGPGRQHPRGIRRVARRDSRLTRAGSEDPARRYSVRNAIDGSTFDARRAGMKLAAAAEARESASAPAQATGSRALTP